MRPGLRQLDGRVAVITGAGAGIGRALARGLHAKGCHLALIDLDGQAAQAVATELAEAGAERRITVHPADVADRERMRALASEVAEAHGSLHLLINNAGIGYEAAFPQTSLETWDKVLGVNLWGVIHGCHFFLPHLAKAEQAHIVNMSSLFGYVGMAGQTVYCASKYAVRGLSEALWEELRGTSVGLTVVHPGSIATDIMKTSDGDDPQLMDRLAAWYEDNAMPPHKAAARIIRGVETGKRRLLVTAEAYLADQLRRLFPVAGNKVMNDLVIRGLGLEDMREKRAEQWQRTMVDGWPWD